MRAHISNLLKRGAIIAFVCLVIALLIFTIYFGTLIEGTLINIAGLIVGAVVCLFFAALLCFVLYALGNLYEIAEDNHLVANAFAQKAFGGEDKPELPKKEEIGFKG